MFSFGQQLYQNSQRDTATLALESYFRVQRVVIAAAQTSAISFFTWPEDRIFLLKTIHMKLGDTSNPVNQRWSNAEVEIYFRPSIGASPTVQGPAIWSEKEHLPGAGLISSGQVAPGNVVTENIKWDLILPQSAVIACVANRTTGDTTQTAQCDFEVVGYLLPPGNWARSW